MAGRVTARVKWWRGAWWVLAQGPGIRNASGRKAKKMGPSEEDRAKAEKVAERNPPPPGRFEKQLPGDRAGRRSA